MNTRSLTQAEAERRAALLDGRAVRRRGRPDRSADRARRCGACRRSTFTCRRARRGDLRRLRGGRGGATLNGARAARRPSGAGSRCPTSPSATCCAWRPCRPTRPTGEGVHKAVDPADGEVYLWMSFEPDEARHVWACFDQPDLKAPHAFTVTAPAGVDGAEQQRRPAGRGRSGPRAAGRSRTRRRCRRTTRWSTPARSTRSVARRRTTTSASSPGGRSRAVLERDADEIFTLTEQGLGFFGDSLRDAVPAAQVRPGLHARVRRGDGELRLRHLVGLCSCAGRTPTPAERELLAKVLLHEMAHMWFGNIVTMRWWDDLWLNEAFAEFAGHWAAGARDAYTDAWAAHLADGQARRLPRRPGTDLAPDPPADPRRRPGRVDLRRDHLPQGRLGAAAAHGVRRRGELHRRHDRPTSPGTPGATPRCRT